MPKIGFTYDQSIPLLTTGCELDPIFTINSELMTLDGKYYERTTRTDTNQTAIAYDRPITYTIHLTNEALQQMLGAVMPLAISQQILRMSTPDAPPPPAPEPTPEPVPSSPASVTITPSLATLVAGAVLDFDVTVLDAPDATVAWSAPDGGAIDADGIFTAPDAPGDYRVVVSLVAEPAVNSTAIVTVTA